MVSTERSDVSHPFGNTQTAYVAIPSTASKVNWYDPGTSDKLGEPTLVETRPGEHGDVNVYDANAAPIDDPELTCKLPYEAEGKLDPRIWDTHNFDTKTDDGGDVRWQTVYLTSHDYQGDAIVENELIELTFDIDAPALTVREWDDGNSEWTAVSLGDSDFEFYDLDIREIGMASIAAVVEFRNPTQDPTEYYSLDMRLHRGWTYPLWDERDGEGGVPQGLVDLLDPIASGSAYDPGAEQGLRKRSEL